MVQNKLKLIIVFSTFTLSLSSFAAGFEQLLMWSGKNVGRGSAVTSIVEGPESIYFNPAGLIDGSNNEVVLNATYLRSKFEAPTTTSNSSTYSKDGRALIGSLFYSKALSEKFALGVGIFPSAGLKVDYDSVNLGAGVSGAPRTDFKVLEFSTGAAYKVTPKLSVGLAYRVAYTTADFTALKPGPAVVDFSNMKGWDYFSFRGGAQYKEDTWGVGLAVRTPIHVKLEGDLELRSPLPTENENNAKIETTFPLAISVGGHYYITPNLALLLDYNFLNYKATDKLDIDSSLVSTDLPLNWKNGHIVRLGTDWHFMDNSFAKWFLRGGVVVASAITNADTMIPTSEPPGVGYLFACGLGANVKENLDLNFSIFHGFAQKKVSSSSALSGDYKIQGTGFNLGAGLKF